MAKNLSGKKALVTGAGGGIGQAIVESLKAHGVTVAGTDQNACPNSDVSIVGNLMDAAFCDALPSKAREELGGLDIVSTLQTLVEGALTGNDFFECARDSTKAREAAWAISLLFVTLTSVLLLNMLIAMCAAVKSRRTTKITLASH